MPTFQNILVPTDFSETSKHAFEYATSLGQFVLPQGSWTVV